MKCKAFTISLTIIFILFSIKGFTQNIEVKKFRVLPNDQTARAYQPVKDQNGEKCALIKVVTNQSGFAWEGGGLGITKVINKTGEYWVYVPKGSKKITIKHDQLGVLRNYIYPKAIKEATVYEMILTTGEVKTVVEEKEISSQWLIIKSQPAGASVFIDDNLVGSTPFQRKYKEGEYTYRLEKPRYHNKAGKINLKNNKKRLELTLKPRFGNIKVTSEPESNMRVYLDEENTGKKTPATLKEISSGNHNIELQSQWYLPKAKQVTVKDEQTTNIHFTLKPAFANISVTANPAAAILVDGQRKGKGSWRGRLMEGIYTIKAQKEKYYNQTKQIEISPGEDQSLTFDLKGKTGDADIVTTPMDALIYLNGKKKGTSPLTLKDLIVGQYDLKIIKKGYGTINQTITIQEDRTVMVKKQLPAAKEITLSSKPLGAKVYIDGRLKGNTPQTLSLSFGKHQIRMIHKEITEEKEIDLSESGKNKWIFKLTTNGTFMDYRDGQTYKWTRIGDQVWMAENLNYDQSAYGNDWCYEGEKSKCNTHGRLYNWEAVMQGAASSNGNPSEVQGVCPDGWHVPSDKEWMKLEKELGMSHSQADDTGYRGTNEGSKLAGKASLWIKGKLKNNAKFNTSGFTALPSGYRGDTWNYFNIEDEGSWWSSTRASNLSAWYRSIYFNYTNVYRLSIDKNHGFSVRCVRND